MLKPFRAMKKSSCPSLLSSHQTSSHSLFAYKRQGVKGGRPWGDSTHDQIHIMSAKGHIHHIRAKLTIDQQPGQQRLVCQSKNIFFYLLIFPHHFFNDTKWDFPPNKNRVLSFFIFSFSCWGHLRVNRRWSGRQTRVHQRKETKG